MHIVTDRLVLKEFLFDDWSAVLEYQRDPRYLQFYPWTERTATEVQEFVRMFLDQQAEQPRRKFQLAVTLPSDTSRVIGNCGIRLKDRRYWEADIGKGIGKVTSVMVGWPNTLLQALDTCAGKCYLFPAGCRIASSVSFCPVLSTVRCPCHDEFAVEAQPVFGPVPAHWLSVQPHTIPFDPDSCRASSYLNTRSSLSNFYAHVGAANGNCYLSSDTNSLARHWSRVQ